MKKEKTPQNCCAHDEYGKNKQTDKTHHKHHNINNSQKPAEHSKHSGHHCGGSAPGMGHGSATMFLRRFWIVTFLLIPLVAGNKSVADFLNLPDFIVNRWTGFIIATIIFGFGLVFFQHAWHEIKSKQYGMMTLVSIAIGSGYLFSAVSTFLPSLGIEFYLEISTLIWVLLFGHYLEAKSGAAAGNALQEVAKLLPKQAHKLINKKTVDVNVSDLQKNDLVMIKPGEKIPADGIVISGKANVDESLISGESKPLEKNKSKAVIAGSICLDGSLVVKLTQVGADSTVGKIQSLIAQAQKTKPKSQRLADKAAKVLTFVAGFTALFTVLFWTIIMGKTFVFAVTLAITVLVIACPHALGLAIPTVTTITTSLAIKNGFFIKNLSKIEIIKKTTYVVFDKTGTLTDGVFGVSKIVPLTTISENTLLKIAASLEKQSSHIIGLSIVNHSNQNDIPLDEVTNFKNIAGKGIIGKINNTTYLIGNKSLLEQENIILSEKAKNIYDNLVKKGYTVVLIADTHNIIGLIALTDSIKRESYEAVKKLHKIGVKVAMLTGDNKSIAQGVASELGIDTFFAEVLPEDKYRYIKKLQTTGETVLMVGDGVNDAPALTQADVGIAIGAGTDVAVEAGDVVLTKNNPEDIVKLIILSKKVYIKMIQNLFWALGYNTVAIPAAAGAFAYWNFFLRPEIGAFIMSLSTVIVVANAMLLKRMNLD